MLLLQEIKSSHADDGIYSKKCITMAVGTLRNLSVGNSATKVQMLEFGIGETTIALCWLCEGDTREKALGTLFNLSAAPPATKLLIQAGVNASGLIFTQYSAVGPYFIGLLDDPSGHILRNSDAHDTQDSFPSPSTLPLPALSPSARSLRPSFSTSPWLAVPRQPTPSLPPTL